MTKTLLAAAALALAFSAGSALCADAAAMPAGVSEIVVDLSAEASKGYLTDISATEDGGFEVEYALPGKKKEDKTSYEVYPFSASLVAGAPRRTEVAKVAVTAPVSSTSISAMIGGTGMSALSTDLKINKNVVEKSWSPFWNRYRYKTVSSKEIKPESKGEEYSGNCDFVNGSTGELAVLASCEVEGKGDNDLQHSVLFFDAEGNKTKTVALSFDWPQSVIYAGLVPAGDAETADLSNSDIGMFFAPCEDAKNIKQITYIRMNSKGDITERLSFDRPAGPMIITGITVLGGSVYALGMSTEDVKASYDGDFEEYISIGGPFGRSWGAIRYYTALKDVEYSNINLIKITAGKIDFVGNTPVADLKALAKPAAGEKKAIVYKGDNMAFGSIVAGQGGNVAATFSTVNFSVTNNFSTWEYTGFFYILFNGSGAVVAENGLERIYSGKDDLVWEPSQCFDGLADNGSIWTVYEPVGIKNFWTGAVEGYLCPRIAKTNLATGAMDYQYAMGGGKYYIYPAYTKVLTADKSAHLYVGSDKGGKQLWVGKVNLK